MSSRPSSFTFTAPGSLRLFSTQELLRRPTPPWFIEDIFPTGGLVSIYGPPGCGKSFIAMDMALSVASGRQWQGRATHPGYVLYIAAEGGPGISKRVNAWLTHYDLKPDALHMAWATEPMAMFRESQDLNTLTERLDVEVETSPSFIVVDTLARCFEGDENTQEDMGAFVAGCDDLRNRYGATVLVIHHTRLDGERERGNTAFRGSLDTLVSVKPTRGLMEVECAKQKDAEDFSSFNLKLQPVAETNSCIVVDEAYDPSTYVFLATLHAAAVESPWSASEIVQRMQESHGWSRAKTFRKIAETSKMKKLLRKNGEYHLGVSPSKKA